MESFELYMPIFRHIICSFRRLGHLRLPRIIARIACFSKTCEFEQSRKSCSKRQPTEVSEWPFCPRDHSHGWGRKRPPVSKQSSDPHHLQLFGIVELTALFHLVW